MSVTAGSRLGSYEILAFVGAGGMGEVYRARDTRLGRDVAIKLLHPGDRANQRRRQRLLQEARTAATLNHPNIATVHDIVSVDGTDFIVMEYVDGQTLSALLRSGLALPEVLRVAVVIADALARAHSAGIVHRDLKPANVLVASDGTVKVLDFGLAKLVEPEEAGGQDQTITEEVALEALSRPGAIMGSPGYMSPEQATGSRVDTRSDIFSFGSMLYEMATGRRAFLGDSVASTLAKVVREEPATPSEVTPSLPRALERLILRCLRKQPDRRVQHIVDVKVELQEIKDELESTSGTAPAASGWRRARWPATALGVFVAVIVAAWTLVGRRHRESPAARLVSLTATSGIEATPAFSPDGSQMVYAWDGAKPTDQQRPSFDIWLKLVAGPEARRLTTNPADDLGPTWSPDGRQIAFLRGRLGQSGTVYLISPLGGPERKLSDLPVAGSDASWLRGAAIPQLAWSPDGQWLAVARARATGDSGASAGGIHLIPLAGGEPHPVTFPGSPSVDRDPAFSPEGRRLAYASCPAGPFAACDLQVVALDGQMKPRSPPRQVARAELSVFGLAWSADGSSLVYGAARGGLTRLWRVTLDGSRPAERIELGRQGLSPAIAPGANRLAFVQIRKDTDIYSFEAGRPNTAVVFSSSPDSSPSFSPDGRRIAFASGRSGEVNEIWLADADGSNPMQLTHGPGNWQGSPSWSPDGRRIAFDSRGQDGLADIWSIDADGGGQRRVTDRPGNEVLPSWSRDGQWIYHRQDRPDGHDIWRVPSTGGAAAQVTFNGGLRALESADGKTLFFVPRDDESPLFSRPAAGGPPRQIADCVLSRSLASGPDGLYYVACPVGLLEGPLHRLDPLTGDSRRIGTLSTGGGFVNGLTVAPEGGRILFTRLIADDADLMMIEGFR